MKENFTEIFGYQKEYKTGNSNVVTISAPKRICKTK